MLRYRARMGRELCLTTLWYLQIGPKVEKIKLTTGVKQALPYRTGREVWYLSDYLSVSTVHGIKSNKKKGGVWRGLHSRLGFGSKRSS